MRFLAILALLLGLSGGAKAFTLFEVETNNCFCDPTDGPTTGGTIETSLLSGVLTAGDTDYYRFQFAADVPYLLIRPVSPDIANNDEYPPYDLVLLQEFTDGDVVSVDEVLICADCWYLAGAIEAYNLPAGTYYIGVEDRGGGGIASIAFNQQDGPFEPQPQPQFRLLGAYQVAITTPEPASLALFGTALAALALRRRRA